MSKSNDKTRQGVIVDFDFNEDRGVLKDKNDNIYYFSSKDWKDNDIFPQKNLVVNFDVSSKNNASNIVPAKNDQNVYSYQKSKISQEFQKRFQTQKLLNEIIKNKKVVILILFACFGYFVYTAFFANPHTRLVNYYLGLLKSGKKVDNLNHFCHPLLFLEFNQPTKKMENS